MKKLLAIVIIASIFASCRKYVDIAPYNTRTLVYTSDYRDLLNNNSVFEGAYGYPLISGDDMGIDDINKQKTFGSNAIQANIYTWSDTYVGSTISDADWDKLYNVIYNCNVVTDGVVGSKNGNDADKQELLAEAKVHRAFAYWCLVNMYAKEYDPTTAKTDLGVPLLLTSNLFTKLNRVPVQTVYDQILQDLKTALPNLPSKALFDTRPSKAAAYALLSRTYLFMRNFTAASNYADSTLNLQNTLLDLNNYINNTSAIPQRLVDPEIIFSKFVNSYYALPVSSSLLTLLGTSDLRYQLFTQPGSQFFPSFAGRGYWRYNYTFENICIGPNVPEIMLIRAECAARNGDASTAINLLNALRKKRFAPADYVDYTIGSVADALSKVVDERQRELFGRGFRWFDQKRLNLDATFAITETRVFLGTTYTLVPGSNHYVYPIGEKYILLNPEIQQNPK